MLELIDGIYLGNAQPDSGGGSSPVIEELNVTPSTSSQTITAPSGTDGYSPVNVSAVTASIDANITAGNIKSGVSILGVTGDYSGGAGSTITATNKSLYDVTSGQKVWIEENSNNYDIVDFYKLEYESFNVIGNLTINTKTGVASGFSDNDYIQLKGSFNPSSTWEMRIKFTTGDSLPTYQLLVCSPTDFQSGVNILLHDATVQLYLTSNNTYWNISNGADTGKHSGDILAPNTTYWLNLSFGSDQYVLSYSEDGNSFTNIVTVNSSTQIKSTEAISFGKGGSNDPFLGSINLSESYIKENGFDWWTAIFTKTVNKNLNPNITNTGNISINPYFVASGFSTSKYLSSSGNGTYTSSTLNSFDVIIHIKTGASFSGSDRIYQPSDVSYTDSIRAPTIAVDDDMITLMCLNNGGIGIAAVSSATTNTEYWCRWTYDGTSISGYYSNDGGVTWTLTESKTYTPSWDYTGFKIGCRNGGGTVFNGEVYLSDYVIKINDEIWWEGTHDAPVLNITENSLSGIAGENIASGSSGQVSVILSA